MFSLPAIVHPYQNEENVNSQANTEGFRLQVEGEVGVTATDHDEWPPIGKIEITGEEYLNMIKIGYRPEQIERLTRHRRVYQLLSEHPRAKYCEENSWWNSYFGRSSDPKLFEIDAQKRVDDVDQMIEKQSKKIQKLIETVCLDPQNDSDQVTLKKIRISEFGVIINSAKKQLSESGNIDEFLQYVKESAAELVSSLEETPPFLDLRAEKREKQVELMTERAQKMISEGASIFAILASLGENYRKMKIDLYLGDFEKTGLIRTINTEKTTDQKSHFSEELRRYVLERPFTEKEGLVHPLVAVRVTEPVKVQFGGRAIPLTQYWYMKEGLDRCETNEAFGYGGKNVLINRTAYGEDVQEVIHELFEEIKGQTDSSQEQTLKDIGKLHWVLLHGKPFQEENTLITERLIDALARSKGIKIREWSASLYLEALTKENLDDFSEKYRELIVVD